MRKLFASALVTALTLASLGLSPVAANEAVSQQTAVEIETTLNLRFPELPVLGESLVYEGWIIVDGAPVTSGRFRVGKHGRFFNEDGQRIKKSFVFDGNIDIEAFVLTIEPAVGDVPAPADTHILGGTFLRNGRRTDLTVDHFQALGQDFSDAAGSFILATPSNGDGTPEDERSGVWFLDLEGGSPAAGLDLPELTPGWEYEGWAVVDGVPISTGKFTNPAGPDDFSGFSGSQPTPPFPGEDFLNNAPDGVEFPVDLRGAKIAITVEPFPDDSAAPFQFVPLKGQVADDLDDHQTAELNDSDPNPRGRAWIQTRPAR